MVVYVGDSRSREVIRTFEFPVDQSGSGVRGLRRARSGGSGARSREFRFEVGWGCFAACIGLSRCLSLAGLIRSMS